jgi:hypothetical protein
MVAIRWLVRHRLTHGWVALVPLALVVALGGAGAIVALTAADRTANAYPRYLDRAAVGDLVVNPSLNTADFDRAIRDLPGVRSVTSDALYVAGVDLGAGEGTDEAASDLYYTQVRGSVDGRYDIMDRPSVTEGRLPTGPGEVLVNAELAERAGIELGETLPVEFRYSGESLDVPGAEANPIGRERLTVVGIAALAGEVLSDPLYPRYHAIVSPDVARRYDCVPDVPPEGTSFEEAVRVLAPDDCAVSFRYYSLDLTDGTAGVPGAVDDARQATVDLQAELPQAVRDAGATYFLVATTTAREAERVARAVRPTVAALGVLGVAAALVTVVVAGLAAARELRRSELAQAQWWQLGMGEAGRMIALVVPLIVAMAVGLAVALAAGWWLSPFGPVGAVRTVDPSPARGLEGWAGAGAAALAVALLGLAIGVSTASAHRTGRRPRHARPARSGLAAVGGDPVVTEGLRAAFTGRGAGLVVASVVVAIAAILTATAFAASLTALVSTPTAYGWTWDLAVIGNVGYGPVDGDAVEVALEDRADVAGWTALGFTNSLSLEGDVLLSMISDSHGTGSGVTVIKGESPDRDGQVALGLHTAAERGIDVGASVEIEAYGETRRATVSGLVVFPALGPFLSDRATPGTGMLLPAAMFDENDMPADIGFVGIDLVEGAQPAAVRADLGDDVDRWDLSGDGLIEFDAPIPPPEIDDARSIRSLPILVAGLVALAATVGLTFAVVVSVRSRRHHLAILRAVGLTGSQVRRSVRVQALAIMAAAIVVGLPLGIVAGRLAWRSFATQLGVAPDASIPVPWVAVTVAGGLVIAIVAASIPAWAAARAHPARDLRSE